MRLSKKALDNLDGARIDKPSAQAFQLPEKVIQFGTGVLLRGLCDYFINKANGKQIFNGRIVVVKSTDAGDTDAFAAQDNLYTICSRGIDNGSIIKENVICASISRVLSAKSQWESVLALAENPSIEIIISNTTEVGLQFVEESIRQSPPSSYPAKLLALLYRRFQYFKGETAHGFVVVPTELITENGNKLKGIVEKLAAFNRLENNFIEWMNVCVHFCNSLVDRIVTKDPGEDILNNLQKEIGYTDELLTMCEDYRLWAIQGNDHVAAVLGFTAADDGVFVRPDIEIYKSLKLHLLNGTHTFSACLAFLAGFETVKQAMDDPKFYDFVRSLMLEEIGSAMPGNISSKEVAQFGTKVLDRFQNPFLRHLWLNITFQCTTKMRMRNVGVLKRYHELHEGAPVRMATGFAAYILFMRPVRADGKIYYGSLNGNLYPINDEHAQFFYELWQREHEPQRIVEEVLGNRKLWETDLNALAPFAEAVTTIFTGMLTDGVQFENLKASTDISQ
jgi:tagaturonate reductase